MQRILIVGAGFLQVPMIKKAKEMGLYVGVVDYNPSAPGVSIADEFYHYSTIDKDGLLKAANEFKPNGICTMATDMPMRAIAYVCHKKGLNCISEETAFNCTNKISMIECFKRNGVSSPFYYFFNDLKLCKEKISSLNNYPLIMKPSDSSGSRGVIIVNSFEDIDYAFEYSMKHSSDGYIIVEEFMQGSEVSVECFVVNSEPVVIQVTDKITTGSPHFVETGHIEPSTLEKKVLCEIRDLAKKACLALEISNGPAHVEMIATKSGPKMIEVGARMGGDCITSHLVPLSTGIDMIKATINNALGLSVDIKPKYSKFSCIKFLTSPVRYISSIHLPEIKDKNYFVEMTNIKGENSTSLHSSNDRIGYIIGQDNNKKILLNNITLIEKEIIIE